MFRLPTNILRSGFVSRRTSHIPYILQHRYYADQSDKSFKSLLDEISASIKPRSDNSINRNSEVGGSFENGAGNERERPRNIDSGDPYEYSMSNSNREYDGGNGVRGNVNRRTDSGGNYGGGRGDRGGYGGNNFRNERNNYGDEGGYGGMTERRNYGSNGSGSGRGGYGGRGTGGYGRERGGYGGGGGGAYGGRSGMDSMSLDGKLQPVEWTTAELSPINKSIYTEHPEVAAMSPGQAAEWRKEHSITIKGTGCPNPIVSFSQSGFSPEIQRILTSKYTTPTPIQAQGWSLALSGKDMVGSSQTGSGKTLGFLLPALARIFLEVLLGWQLQPHKWSDGPIAVVLAPTRELALQIISESAPYTRALGLNAVPVFGGESRGPQQMKLRKGVHLLVATPGRLIDFLSDGTTNLRRVSYVVLDEADRMLDMGFEPQIRQIISQLRPDRQTLMWSATWPYKVQTLAHEFFNDPITIHVGSTDLRANPNVRQKIHITSEREKQKVATELIKQLHKEGPVKTLIFCATKDTTEHIHYYLASQGYNTAAIHGGKNQAARLNMLGRFRDGQVHILVATDVAARGLDIDNIQHVINYDFPAEIEDYIHRIGRTGRAGKQGHSHSFLSHERHPGKAVSELIKVLHDAGQEVSDELRSFSASMHSNRGGNYGGARNFYGRR